nr:hypothetical protein [Candidatus Sigynarchaeota archaeon]
MHVTESASASIIVFEARDQVAAFDGQEERLLFPASRDYPSLEWIKVAILSSHQ